MFYTNRRANVPGLSGVAWVHGTPIGIAESADGAAGQAAGTAEIQLPSEFGGKDATLWAPDIVRGDEGVNGGHPGVVVNNDRVFLFYFTHPGRAGTIKPEDKESLELRRSSIQVVELFEKGGWLTCDRDQPTHIRLVPPAKQR